MKEIAIEQAIINCFNKHSGNYGRIRIKKELYIKCGIVVSENKISKILQKNGLIAISGRKSKPSKKARRAEYITDNKVWNKFNINKCNELWCSDITELKYNSGKLYVCGVIDVASRKIVGWSIDKKANKEFVHSAITMAYFKSKMPKDVIFHSDRGCQYTALKTKELLDKYEMIFSMSRPGTPSDNLPIETLWKSLKREMPAISNMGYEQAKRTIVKYIELYYNSERLHSSLDYKTPNEVWAGNQ